MGQAHDYVLYQHGTIKLLQYIASQTAR